MDRELTVVEHLAELRTRIIKSLAAIGIATILNFPFAGYLLKILKLPASGILEKLAFFSPQDAFLVYMRVSFLAGFILSFPIIAYQFWAFVSPAIQDRFKKYAASFIIFCSLTFIAGCLFAYLILLPRALKFLLNFGLDELEPVISASSYITFTTGMILCCGLIFQMPVLSFFLTRLGLINARILRKKFGIAVIAIFIFAAVITPTTDIFNMSLLAIPMLFLYELSIWVSYFAGAKAKKRLTKP